MITGQFECKLDAKGRLVLPAKIKARLPETAGSQVVLKQGLEPCVVLYSVVEYNKSYARIASLSEFDPEYRKLQRNFFIGVSDVEIDSAGRILIPKQLLKYANLEKEVTLIGAGSRIEIWNPEILKEYLIEDKEELSDLTKKLLSDK